MENNILWSYRLIVTCLKVGAKWYEA